MNFEHDAVLVRAGETLLDFLAVRKGEDVLITVDTALDPAVSTSIFGIAERLGAHPSILVIPQLPFQGTLADPYTSRTLSQATKSCDVWIDLTFPYLAGSSVHDHAMAAKSVRYILGGDMRRDNFRRLFGLVDMDQYYEAQSEFDRIFTASIGQTVHITNRLGTDLRFKLDKTSLTKPRRATGPGMYLVPGTCSVAPDIKTVTGTVVVSSSFHEFYEALPSPITLKVNGKISELSGGGHSRVPLNRAMLRAGGGEYGSIIHFSHGLHPAARVTGKCFIEDMRAHGCNAVGLGIPWWEPGGGENHPDVILTEQSLWIEDRAIVRDGIVVGPASLVALADKLGPLTSVTQENTLGAYPKAAQ